MELKELEQRLRMKQKQIGKNIDRCCNIAEKRKDTSTFKLIHGMIELNQTQAEAMATFMTLAASEKAVQAYQDLQLAVVDFMEAATEGMAERMEKSTREGKR